MQTLDLIQGTPEWLAVRAQHFTASEAPAMMGISPYMTRTELLNQKHTGLVPTVDIGTQKRFDNGHAVEAAFRPIAEKMIGDELYPVTGTLEIDGLKLLASYDGLTMDSVTALEHKAFNAKTAEYIDAHGEPPMHHVWQLEQQLLVAGAKSVLFATSDGTENNFSICYYESKPERRAALLAGWKQFATDLAAYVPSTVTEDKPTGHAPDTLPALHIEVTGMVTASNLADFKATALAAIRSVNIDLQTDQHFADAEQSVKWCTEVEQRLQAAKAHALSQTASIDELFKAIDDIAAEAKRTRLDLSKLITTRKDAIRSNIIHDAQNVLAAHVMALNMRIGKPLMPAVPADFAGSIKGKRSLDSIHDAVAVELARAKIASNEAADRIQINLRTIEAVGMPLLFADLGALVHKAPDDLAAVIENRVAKFKADEAARVVANAAIAQAQQAPAPAPAPVVTAPAPVVADTGELIKLKDINARLAPIAISADGLAELGFAVHKQEGGSELYRACDFTRICAALTRRIAAAAEQSLTTA